MRILPALLIGILLVGCGAQSPEESASPSEKIGTAESAATFNDWKGSEQAVLTAVQPVELPTWAGDSRLVWVPSSTWLDPLLPQQYSFPDLIPQV